MIPARCGDAPVAGYAQLVGGARVVIAPDKFKGTLTAPDAARSLAMGWRRGDPEAEVEEVPVADGGEGTLDTLLAALGGDRHRARVTGPLGDPVDAEYGLVRTRDGLLAIVEMAKASGLALLDGGRPDPARASTFGTGELILAACRHEPTWLVVCVGGSATNDGGAGAAQALGIRLLDEQGEDLPRGGEALERLARIDARGLHRTVRGLRTTVASDVDNPLIGPRGAAAVFGPQKGASEDDVVLLERALGHLAAVIHRDLAVDVRHLDGGGAAGGLAAGLVAFLGARIRPGFDMVAEVLNIPERLDRADVAVTGEGRFDRQSAGGKAPARILEMAKEARCRSILIAGEIEEGVRPGADEVYSLAARAGREAAMTRPAELLEEAAADAAAIAWGG
jgi:glycerate kinase